LRITFGCDNEIRPGSAIVTKVGGDGNGVSLTLSGCQFQVVLED
jgi:hypothetical protein